MKKLFAITILVLGTVLSGFAQPGSNQELFFGYTAGWGPVRLVPTESSSTIESTSPSSDRDNKAFTNGVTLGYTVYFHKTKDVKTKKVGVGLDVNLQFRDGLHPVTATAVGGLVFKARADKKVQPFVRVMAGGARLGFKQAFINGCCLVSTAEYSPAVVAGAGLDVAKEGSRLKWRIGADYVRTFFGNDSTQNFVRVTTGIVF